AGGVSGVLSDITAFAEQGYDRWGNVISRSVGRFIINASGAISDADRRTTLFEYNADNQVTLERLAQVSARRADGTAYSANITHELRYDLLGRVVQEVDAADDAATAANEGASALRTRTRVYNAAGQLIKEQDATSHLTEYAYDAHGNRIGVKNARGIVFVDSFDGNGNVLSHGVLRQSGGATPYRSGLDSNPVAVTLNLYQYDQANRRTGSA